LVTITTADRPSDGACRCAREGCTLRGHTDSVLSAAFSPDGKRIVTASGDKTARLWDAGTGRQIGQPLKGHTDSAQSAVFSPDGKRIVTAYNDNTARLRDAGTGKQIGEPLTGHTASVFSAAFSPDGKRIITASDDDTVRLWDAEAGTQIGEPYGQRVERGVQPRRQAHRHRVWRQNGAGVGNFCEYSGTGVASQSSHSPLPNLGAAKGVLLATRAAALVYRA
jgi:WD40 repeat protein